jgi:hypothetical protein
MTIYADHEILQVAGRDRRARRVLANGQPTRPRVVTSKQRTPGRAVSRSFLPFWIHFSAHEVIPCLAFSNQCELVAANQRFCRERT